MKLFLLLAVAVVGFGQVGGSISGVLVDSSGASVSHVQVKLSVKGYADQETQSSPSGEFLFTPVPSGTYHLSFSAPSFAPKSLDGKLNGSETIALPPVVLTVATVSTNVVVTQTQAEVAEDQIKLEEKQRVLAFIPNYLVNYDPDAEPLNARQKFELTWKTFLDPVSFLATGIIAGVEQANNSHKGFGQGAQGYGKRYGAAYADFVTANIVSSALLPIVFKEDPRYLYKGTGTVKSRFWYALSRSVICRNDNKKDTFCYSSFLGRFAAGGLSNLYYPADDRNSTAEVFENGAIGIGGDALANLLQEFLIRKLTPKKH